MAFGKMGARGGFGSLGVLGIANASSFAEGQIAPPGWQWDFLYDDVTGERLLDDVTNIPLVDLKRIDA